MATCLRSPFCRAVSGDAYLPAAGDNHAPSSAARRLDTRPARDSARGGASGIAAGSPGSRAPRAWEDPGASRGAEPVDAAVAAATGVASELAARL